MKNVGGLMMFRTKLCLGTSEQFGISVEEQIKLFKKVGFEAFFTEWDENIGLYRRIADETEMIYQSVHAPFGNSAKMWSEAELAEEAVKELLKCVDDCAKYSVPILIIHPYIGFEEKAINKENGINNFRIVIEEAKRKNVKIAFENVEGEEYLKILMDEFAGYENVGFCWDSGHEQCYNCGRDMLELYGNKIIATHINDNLGVRDYNGVITFYDDLHLLPFDGIINWEQVMKRLNKCGYDDILTFELNKFGKPDRHENDKYAELSIERYITECYIRACKIATIKLNV